MNYQDYAKLLNITDIGSEYQNNPLTDPEITIFFTNGYRLINMTSVLGQSIEFVPINSKNGDLYLYTAIIAFSIDEHSTNTLEPMFTQKNNHGTEQITKEEFNEKLINIAGPEIYELLKARNNEILVACYEPIGIKSRPI